MGEVKLERYSVDVSPEAEQDLSDILNYIKNELLEPAIATKYLKLIREKIDSLEYYPERFGIIENELIRDTVYRKIVIKNYIVIYRVDKEKKIVHIVRVAYGGRNFEKLL